MCWMSIRRDDAPLASGIDACKQHERHSGGHSWGYAVSDGTKLELFKQTGTIDRFKMAPQAQAALVHTRLATQGAVTQENAHPFLMTWDGDVRTDGARVEQAELPGTDGQGARTAALGHNGTWHEAPTGDSDRCDSYFIARDLEQRLRDGQALREAVGATGDKTGETFIVLTDTARCFVHSGRFSITMQDDVVQSSDLSDEIERGRVVEL